MSEDNGEEGITKVFSTPLYGKGLKAGTWHFLLHRLIGEGSTIHEEKDYIFRIELNEEEPWENILKLIPKGSLIKYYKRIR